MGNELDLAGGLLPSSGEEKDMQSPLGWLLLANYVVAAGTRDHTPTPTEGRGRKATCFGGRMMRAC
jgi:hypothetical protein